jgi:hypothetical protein
MGILEDFIDVLESAKSSDELVDNPRRSAGGTSSAGW